VEFEKEAGVVVAVMRYVERGNLDSFNLKWFLLFDMNGGAIEAIPYQPVVGDASVHLPRGVNRDVHLLAEVADRSDMVVVIVGNQDGHDGRQVDPHVRPTVSWLSGGPIPASIRIP